MKINARVEEMTLSPVRKVLDRARQLEREGKDIVHFEIGEPDFDTPEPIKQATKDAIDANLTHYGPNRGLLSLRTTISRTLLLENNLSYDPETEIIVTLGAAEALLAAMFSYISEGDEVIIFTPAFMNYRNLISMAGGKAVAIPLEESEDFQLNPDRLRAAITDKTSMIIVNNPHNPTGTVFSKSNIEAVATIAKEHDLLVLSDEIYQRITYDGEKCTSIGSLEGMKRLTITINGFSKSHAMTGWRLGYVAAHKDLILPLLKIHQYVNTCAPTFLQQGLSDALKNSLCDEAVTLMVERFSSRRKLLVQALKAVPGIRFVLPYGAFYLFMNVSGTGLDGTLFASRLLEETGVAVVPGEGFDHQFTNYVRISYATSEEEIVRGVKRIGEFVKRLGVLQED